MSIKLYFFPISQPSRSVLMLCREGGVEVEEVVVDVMKGEHKAPEYLAVNPMGLVPAIVDGDFTLAEGAAILAYIAESRGLTTWFPSDPKVRAR
jgi:glutathione S-transferase